MRFYKRPLFVIEFIALLLGISSILPNPDAYAQSPPDQKTATYSENAQLALEHISQIEGTPLDQLLVVNEHLREYPLTQGQLWGITMLDQRTFKFHHVLVDAAAKKVLDPVQVEAAERQAYLSRYGKLDPALYTRLQTASPDEAIPAAIQLTTPDLTVVEAQLASSQAKDPDQIRRERLALSDQVLSAQARPLVEMLESQGHPVYTGQYLPFVTTELTPALIHTISTRPDVAMIHLAGNQTVAEMDEAVQTQRVKEIWNDMGIDGSGINIAILEDEPVENNPYLNVIATRLSETSGGHATRVASVAAANHPDYRGVAFGANILSANHNETDLGMAQAFEWAVTNNADVINISEGVFGDDDYLHWIDDAIDFAIRQYRVTVVKSAGNQKKGNHLTSPGKGFGIITVGGTDDHDNPKWTDDEIYDRTDEGGLQSAWKNPRINLSFVQSDAIR